MICATCFRHCDLSEGQVGFCRGRMLKDGQIVARNYGRITSLALDPIEKKPLSGYKPGSMILSAGSFGCNLACPFCQNHEIAQNDLMEESEYLPPEILADFAWRMKDQGNIGVAFTYNEPLISWEYIRDCARLLKKQGMDVVVVSNGTAEPFVLDELEGLVDAWNIDLKGFDQDFYDYVHGDLEQVKAFIEKAAKNSHVEVTTLLIPGKNDDEESIEKLARFLARIDPDIILHLTRYFPRYHEDLPPTSLESLKRARKAAGKHLRHVELGNV